MIKNSNPFKLDADSIQQLQQQPSCVRNICILAHVDHGKTTIADSLIATNGIISERLAGELRYMDSREDEQERGITMKSSAVSLRYDMTADGRGFCYLINLIDSPGHVDFSTEVSTAVRLCDGAFVIVDVVEGVGPQTCAVLRQAWIENIKPVLILNKIDRLFTELKLSPLAIYNQLRKIVEQVNAVIGQFVHSDLYTSADENSAAVDFDNVDDSDVYFQPEKGNVLFASAVDKWAFSLNHFAKIYAPRLGVEIADLLSSLWGDYFFESSTRSFKYGAEEKGKTPMFVKIVMENIYAVYETILQGKFEKLLKICEHLKLEVNERRLSKSDNRLRLQAVLGKWMPLADGLLSSAVTHLPSPNNLSEKRIERLLSTQLAISFKNLPKKTQHLKNVFMTCESCCSVPTIIFVSKLFPVPSAAISDSKRRVLDSSGDTVFLAFARVFSGTVRPNQKIYLIEPKYIPSDDVDDVSGKESNLPEYVKEVELGELFFLMGREVEKIQEVRAGNVFGISGLDNYIFKSGTLSSSLACPPFLPVSSHSVPIVQVAIEPMRPSDDAALQSGLQLLHRSDPCVEVSVSNTSGEFLIRTAGEVHLHRCLTDLKERFSGIELRVSQPTVPFRETIASPVPGQKLDSGEEIEPGLVKLSSLGNFLTIKMRAFPLPSKVVEFLASQELLIKQMHRTRKLRELGHPIDFKNDSVALFKQKLVELAKDCGLNVGNILAFGPRHSGTNILTISSNDIILSEKNIWSNNVVSNHDAMSLLSIHNSILNGFQLASSSGPICEEPMSGVCFTIESIDLSCVALENVSTGTLNGQTVSLVKECCRRSFSSLPQRLIVAMYTCTVQTTPETLGKLHGVISRRCGRVVSEDTNDTCSQFVVTAVLPVIESFGLADELRKKTSGQVLDPQLKFSHWEIIDADPTIVFATTEENDDDDSLEAALHSQSRRYMLAIRRRKGLATGEQLVVSAEKQRTMSKKK